MSQNKFGLISSFCLLFLMAGCSDDGGGPYAVYSGATGPVDITTSNIFSLVGAAMSEPQGASMTQGLVDNTSGSGPFPCTSGSGSATVSLNANGEGTLSATFSNCNFSGVIISGTFDATLGAYNATLGDVTTSNISMNISMNFSGIVANMTGSINSVKDVGLNQITTTANLVTTSNITDVAMKMENFVTVVTVPDLTVPDEFDDITYNGRIYMSNMGYIDISTGTALSKTNVLQGYPDGGGPMSILGQGSESAEILPQSSIEYQLSLDADGDTTFESVTTVSW